MNFERNIWEFPVTVYGELEKYNETLSKARCRIFYKGPNRNGTFITDDFAEGLLSTLPYTPVKGIYDKFNDDYSDHGSVRHEGRIYGIVPENPNVSWEAHLDEDGVERTYACTDVLLFTGLYQEAGEIVGKSQSMELYEPSIKGEFQTIQGKKYFVFTEGCFLGLQVLGDEVEPCFEGAAFFQLVSQLQETLEKLEKYNLNSTKGGNTMHNICFRLSDGEKHNLLWSALNPSFNEEEGWVVDYSICEVYDEYALAFKYEDGTYWRVYYTKGEDSIELGEKVQCYIVDVTESEKSTLETIQALNGGNYELLDEKFTKAAEDAEKITEFEQKIEEFNTSISTLETEKEELTSSLETVTAAYTQLQEETEALKSYKLNKETEEKMAVIEKYSAQLEEEVLNKYKENVSEFTMANLERELAFEFVQSKPSIFSNEQLGNVIPKDNIETDSLSAILEKYRK